MFKKIALAAVVLVAAVLLFAATRPDSIRVQRSTSIKAAPEKIFPLIADFHAWSAWSPWEKLDPAMKRTHSGAPSGKGAAYAWDGNNDVGAGRMEIAEVVPPSRITIKLDFSRPMEGHNTAEFTLVPKGDASEVTWTMVGPSPYLSKLIGLFLDMDKMIGKDFEAGLANLKALAEK
ncbi:MAG: SRPBCC family protein [Sterolibacteriaceae bacterium]|nr:SRPBCC family protein [Candidatus Methylophosphatis haderslevensis]